MQVMEVKPYVVHQTFQYGGTKGKRHRLREARLWYDEPAYYEQGRFIHAELDNLPAPAQFDKLSEFEMSEFHLLNMRHQLLQVWRLAVAQLVSDLESSRRLWAVLVKFCLTSVQGRARAAGEAAARGGRRNRAHCGDAKAAVLLRPLLGPTAPVPSARRQQAAAAFRVPTGSHNGAIPL